MPEHTTADAYRALADRIEDADDPGVWGAFAEQMDEMARTDQNGRNYAGFALAVSTSLIGTGAPLGRVIGIGHRQFGREYDRLEENALAKDADVYAIQPTSPNNPLERSRKSVVVALRDAADAE